MPNNLQLYHKMRRQFCQWLPNERKTRIENMALFITGLYLSGQPHLSKIVRKWPLNGKLPSLANRLWRFLNNPRVDVVQWYKPVAQEIVRNLPTGPITLVVDTTKVGFYHRVLSIGVAFKKRTLPLVWSVHRGRKGHTKVDEQLALFKKVAKIMPKTVEIWVVGDTEFQSVHLLRWFRSRHWHFVIRQQGKNKVCWQGQPWVKINALSLAQGQTRLIGWVRLTDKHNHGWYWLLLHWETGEEEPWYLVSDQSGKNPLLKIYRQRMWIEEMFGDMKKHGFDLECSMLHSFLRLSRLTMAVAFLYVWLVSAGTRTIHQGLRHLVDRKGRRDLSIFQIGLRFTERRLVNELPIRISLCNYL